MPVERLPLPALLETARLSIRQITRADLVFLNELHSDPEVTRYLGGSGAPRPPEANLVWAESTMRWYGEERVGQYLVCLRETGEAIGRSGFSCFEIERQASSDDGIPIATWGPGSAAGAEVKRVLEVGYTFQRASWGKGFASEAAARWYEYAHGEYGADRAYSLIHEQNAGSIGVARKLGLTRIDEPVRLDGDVYSLFSPSTESGPDGCEIEPGSVK